VLPIDQRGEVFGRIREALRVPAPHRHAAHGHEAVADEGLPGTDAFSAWLPAVGESLDEQHALFAQNSAQLKTEVHACSITEEAVQHLIRLARENNWKRVATHRHPLAFPVAEKLDLPQLVTDAGYAIADLESCDAGITGCDALVAQTGSIMVSARSAGGRALSVLPPHHIVIAQRGQIVPDLASALRGARERYAPKWPSFLSFITGPSRTGDIERILVLGAHGPKRLTVLIVP
jgi:L-lactate dehydrogenase complex protein LldG